VLSAGAYGMSMSSNYNSRPRAAEVMVDGADVHLVRSRETVSVSGPPGGHEGKSVSSPAGSPSSGSRETVPVFCATVTRLALYLI